METPEIFIAVICAGFVFFFAMLFGTLLLMRWFRHRERLAMIEQGLTPADAAKPRNGKATLAWGIGITAFGLALLCGGLLLSAPLRVGSARSIASIGPVMLPGLFVLFMGIALVIIYFVTRPAPDVETLEEERFPPIELVETPDLPAPEAGEREEAPEE
jgi:hypothetical protein